MDCEIGIAVIGGGIGGLAAGTSLLRAGFDVHVYEQAYELREVGAGIQVSPNASRILHGIGLAPEMNAKGVKAQAWHQRRWDDGRTLLRTPLGDRVEEVFGFPHYQIHRADLLNALAQQIPNERLHLGHRLVNVVDRGRNVDARFGNGAQIRCGVLVGADGIHSVVRRAVLGDESPSFTGCIGYRGLVSSDRLSHLDIPKESQVWMGPHKHFVNYFVQGGAALSFFAGVDQESWTKESWTERGNVADVLAAYDGWDEQVRTILASVDEIFIWGLFERRPLPRWSVGRVTLLGDACHAMLPFMAQGAAQAIEDGAVLTECLRGTGERNEAEALRIYETLRLPRTSRVQAAANENKHRFHLPDGPEQRERDRQMAGGATDWSFQAVKWLYDFDAATSAATPGDT